ncbi:MAG TPA: hypothetical protein VHE30_24785, partial [Polyangiaceae bacterium]|nr:hypothetical protein [Polyangiaceae bacterium]
MLGGMWRTGVWVALGVLCFGCSAGNDDSSSPSGQGGSAGFGGGGGGSSGDGTGGGATGLTTSPKLDLLLVVDNSLGMTDLQKVLSNSVPKLLQPLTASGSGVIDLHVGVITTSLGSFGTTTCDNPSATPPRPEETNDQAHLLGTRPRAASAGVPEGFLTWTVGADSTSLVEKVQHLVEAADEFGCGYEQTLESAYRFLVDPKPYLTSTIAACPGDSTKQCATQTGVDLELLAERGRFLRNDSALAVVFLSNENDCSTRAGATEFVAMKAETLLPGGSAACETDPNDPCCYQCGSTPPTGCTADPTCKP